MLWYGCLQSDLSSCVFFTHDLYLTRKFIFLIYISALSFVKGKVSYEPSTALKGCNGDPIGTLPLRQAVYLLVRTKQNLYQLIYRYTEFKNGYYFLSPSIRLTY
jgi:hypothetical protein